MRRLHFFALKYKKEPALQHAGGLFTKSNFYEKLLNCIAFD